MVKRTAIRFPGHAARMAGALYFASVAIGACGELLVQGRLGFALVLLSILCSAGMTLLLFFLFNASSGILAALAAAFNLVGLVPEVLQWHPRGVAIEMVFHALYCIAIGWLALRSRLLPAALGLSMALAGAGWLTYLSPQLVHRLSPLNSAASFVGEALFMLWLLVAGSSAERGRFGTARHRANQTKASLYSGRRAG